MKQKLFKKLLCAGMAGVMLISCLSGCGGSDNAKDDTADATKTEDTAKTEDSSAEDSQAEDKSEEQVTIRFAHSMTETDPMYETWVGIMDKFMEENPNINVELELTGSSQYNEKLAAEIASDTLPNVFASWGGAQMIEAVKSGKILDVTEYFENDPDFKAQFAEPVLYGSNNTYEGMDGIWGVPFTNVCAAFYYNTQLFEEAGIEKAPETWTELLDAIEKLKAIDVIPWANGAKEGWRIGHLFSALVYRLNGVEAAKKLGSREMKYSDPEIVEAWEMIQELVDMGAFGPEPASVDSATEMSMVQTGKAAMTFSLSAFMDNYAGSDSEVGEDIGFFNMPVIEGHEEYAKDNFGGGDICWAIASNATDAQIEASWKLCKALSGAEAQSTFANTNTLVVNKDAEADPEKANRLLNDFISVINDANAVCIDISQYDSVATVLTKYRDVTVALVNGQLTPQQAGEEVDAEIELFSE